MGNTKIPITAFLHLQSGVTFTTHEEGAGSCCHLLALGFTNAKSSQESYFKLAPSSPSESD